VFFLSGKAVGDSRTLGGMRDQQRSTTSPLPRGKSTRDTAKNSESRPENSVFDNLFPARSIARTTGIRPQAAFAEVEKRRPIGWREETKAASPRDHGDDQPEPGTARRTADSSAGRRWARTAGPDCRPPSSRKPPGQVEGMRPGRRRPDRAARSSESGAHEARGGGPVDSGGSSAAGTSRVMGVPGFVEAAVIHCQLSIPSRFEGNDTRRECGNYSTSPISPDSR